MKKILLPLWVLCLSHTLTAQDEPRPVFTDNELYIGLTREAAVPIVAEGGAVNRQAFLNAFSEIISDEQLGTLEAPFYSAKGIDLQWVLRISIRSGDELGELAKAFDNHPATHYAERVPVLYLSYTPNDLGTNANNDQWHLYKIKAREAWEYSKGNKLVKVAIVDDAVQINHPDLINNIWVNPGEIANNGFDDDQNGYIDDVNGYDVGGLDNNPLPNNNNFTHGTHCAGISGATTDNNTGVASIGFNITIVPVKCTTTGQTNTVSIPRGYEGIAYAVAAGADIISCSWGSSWGGTTGEQVVEYALDNGALVVAAMGNDNENTLQYPASYDGVISVAATANNDTRSTYSNYHSTTVISAPGNFINSTMTNNSYGSQSGTSMATPLVSGLLGLMKGHMYGIEVSDLKNCLLSTADNIDTQNPDYIGMLGSGRINAEKALLCVDNLKNVPPDIQFTLSESVFCPGSLVRFSAGSKKGVIDSFYWEFPGGVPSTSTQAEPEVLFSGNGARSYFLTAFNQYGQDKDSTIDGVTFSDMGTARALSTGFETGLDGSIWNVFNQNALFGWKDHDFITGNDTNSVIKLNAYGSGLNDLLSTLTSEPLDFSDYGNPVLTFDFSYAARSSSALDSLFIEVSTNGGANFERVYQGGLSSELAVSGISSSAYTPTSDAQWCKYKGACLNISLKKYNRAPMVILRIIHSGKSNGNNLYLDNILVDGNCAAFNTNGAIASTTTANVNACGAVTVDFKDNSLNFPSSYHWYFPGGTPSESFDPDQQVSYDQVGSYDVIFVVENQFGKDSLHWTNKVNVQPEPAVTVSASDTVICEGESLSLTADGANTYTWSPLVAISATTGKTITASPSMNVTYYVEGKDAVGCLNTATISIAVLDAPVAPLIFKSGSRLYIAMQSGVSYQWYRNGVAMIGDTSYEHMASTSGTYEVLLTNPVTGCTTWGRESVVVLFTDLTRPGKGGYNLYPNPVNEQLTLAHASSIGTYKIYSSEGKVVMEGLESGNNLLLDVRLLAPGMYFIQWEGEAQSYRDRFVVHH